MNVIDEFIEWLEGYADLSGYVLSRGMWVESDATKDRRFIAFRNMGGRSPVAGTVRYPQVSLLIVGRRGERQFAGGIKAVEDFASGIIPYAIENFKSGCVFNIEPLAEMIGPGYTEHDRPWYELNFELMI